MATRVAAPGFGGTEAQAANANTTPTSQVAFDVIDGPSSLSAEHRRSAVKPAQSDEKAGFICSCSMDSSCDLIGIDVPKSRGAFTREEPIISQPIRIAVDLAKSVYQIAISTRRGKITGTRRLNRDQMLQFFATQPKSRVFMEACGTAHYSGRKIQEFGHDMVLLPPHQVRPYVRGNKTDRTDARGIMDAGGNEDIYPVPIKTMNQQQMTALHRMRSSWMTERTKRLNSLRGLLREFGVFIAVGARNVVPVVWQALEDADSGVPDGLRPVLEEACQELRDIEARIAVATKQIEAIAKQTPSVELLMTIQALAYSRPRRSSPSSVTFAVSSQVDIWPATSGSRRENTPVA